MYRYMMIVWCTQNLVLGKAWDVKKEIFENDNSSDSGHESDTEENGASKVSTNPFGSDGNTDRKTPTDNKIKQCNELTPESQPIVLLDQLSPKCDSFVFQVCMQHSNISLFAKSSKFLY